MSLNTKLSSIKKELKEKKLHEELISELVQQKQLLKTVIDSLQTVDKTIKVKEYPDKIEVTKLPQQKAVEVKKPSWLKQFSLNDLLGSLADMLTAFSSKRFNVNLDEYRSSKNAISVRLSDGQTFINQLASAVGMAGGGKDVVFPEVQNVEIKNFPGSQDVNITAQDNATIDAFGRLRTSEPYTILDTKQLVDKLPLFYDEAITGAGATSVHDTNRASTLMTVPATTVSSVIRQTKLRGTYQPGKSLLILTTFVMGTGQNGVTKRVGYFDEKNGLFLQCQGTTLSVVRRSYATGSAVDTVITQSNWNVDKLDGTGKSGITIDFTKSQIFLIDLEWLGVGRVRFGFVVDGKIYYCHYLNNANNLAHVYMSTPNLPIRYEIVNNGTGASSSLEHICSSIVSEGGQQNTVLQTYISRDGTLITLANQDLYTPIVSVRLKTANIGTRLSPVQIEVMATTALNYEWRLFINPTVAGTDQASWQDISNSSVQYDITRNATNTITGGHIIGGGYGASTNQVRTQVTGTTRSFLTIGSNVDNSVDELVLAVANIDGNGGSVYGGILVDEYN